MSQFKKPKGIMNRSPSPVPSQVNQSLNRASAHHLSNQSQNYVSDLQKANEKNQNVLTSMLNDGLFDGPDKPLLTRNSLTDSPDLLLSQKEIPRTTPASELKSVPQSLAKAENRPPPNSKELPKAPGNESNLENARPKAQSPAKNDAFKKKASVMVDLDPTPRSGVQTPREPAPPAPPGLTTSQARPAPKRAPEEPLPEGFLKKNPEQVLMLVSLKKIIQHLQEENGQLKTKALDAEVRDREQTIRIKKLESTLEEYQLREKLWNKNPSEYIRFDLDDLNAKLKGIDQNLDKATADNVQEKFLEDVVAKNREYGEKADANTEALRSLRDNLGRLKNTLLTMNNL